MARLPSVGGDDNDWGDILNEYLQVSHTSTGRHKFVSTSVDYAASVTLDVDDADLFTIGALTGNITIANPDGTPTDGQILILRLLQDGTGSRTISWGNQFSFETSTSTATIPTAANARWEMSFRWNEDTSKWELVDISSDAPSQRAEVAFTTSIPFNRLVTVVASSEVSAALTFTPNTTGARPGCTAVLQLTADGVNTPDFSAFSETELSSGWNNANDKVNLCIFNYVGDYYSVTITQYQGQAGALNTPGSFTATVFGSTQINLSWSDVSNETNYELQRSPDNSTWSTINSPAANATTYSNTGLTAATTYYYRLRAVGDGVDFATSGWATANATTDAVTYDEDALAFFTAASITDDTQKDAVDQLVIDLKGFNYLGVDYEFWTNTVLLLPYVGGTAQKHAFDLVSATSVVTWNGSFTHSASGVKGDGTTSYGVLSMNATTLFSNNRVSAVCYSREGTHHGYDFGYSNNSGSTQIVMSRDTGGAGGTAICAFRSGNGFTQSFGLEASTLGCMVGSRLTTTDLRVYKNGSQIGTTTTTSDSTAVVAVPMYIHAVNMYEGGTVFGRTNRELAGFLLMNRGVTALEAAALNVIWETFEDALSRGVQ